MKKEINTANKMIQSLESEKNKLSSDINRMSNRIRALEKGSRSCNLEVQCVPEKKTENVLNIFKKLYEEISVPLSDDDIRSVRRIAKMDPSTERPRNILVTLSSERKRDDVISAFRRYNKQYADCKFNSTHLNIPGEKRTVYVVEHLSPETKQLHGETRKKANELSYKYVWVKYDRVYVRKNDDGPAIHIKNSSCLSKLV